MQFACLPRCYTPGYTPGVILLPTRRPHPKSVSVCVSPPAKHSKKATNDIHHLCIGQAVNTKITAGQDESTSPIILITRSLAALFIIIIFSGRFDTNGSMIPLSFRHLRVFVTHRRAGIGYSGSWIKESTSDSDQSPSFSDLWDIF